MAKLHEILAVKSGITGKVTKIFGDLAELFSNKRHHFTKEIVVFKPSEENKPSITEKNIELLTTVREELKWSATTFANALNVCHQISATNTVAKADVVLNGKVVLKDMPATSLLELEKYLTTVWKPMLEKIPTLDPIKGFVPDSSVRAGVYKAQDRVTSRTAKENYPMVLAPATDKHPAQVQLQTRDVVTGYKHESEWSGMLTPAEKSDLITKCEDFVGAIKQAQARANSSDVTGEKIGDIVTEVLLK